MGGLFDRPSVLVIAIIAVIVIFGSKRLPDAARGIGRSLRIFKAETKGLLTDDETPAAQPVPPQVQAVAAAPVAQPVAPAPVVEQPVVQQPVVQPAAQPVVQPVVQQPVVPQPAAEQPVSVPQQPAAAPATPETEQRA